jgi:tRNA uridine 5-carbamoylmethylation protein Kti12
MDYESKFNFKINNFDYFCTNHFEMAKDIFHEIVKNTLINDGWSITHDPLTIKLSKRSLFIDLGAEKIIAAERGKDKIAVEVKSFVGLSPITDFYKALGQYQLYVLALRKKYPFTILYLAMPQESYLTLTQD